VPNNLDGREIATYEMSKLLGAEGLVPPTQRFEHQMGFGEDGLYSGSAQMSVHDFGKNHLRHSEVVDVPSLLEKTN